MMFTKNMMYNNKRIQLLRLTVAVFLIRDKEWGKIA